MPRHWLVFLLVASIATTSRAQERRAIFPEPRSLRYEPGELPVKSLAWRSLAKDDPGIDFALTRFAEAVRAKTGLALRKAAPGATASIAYRQRPATTKVGVADESYSLVVGPGGVRIEASGPAGFFYGLQTLQQMIGRSASGQWILPFAHIDDAPALPYRGVMMDFAHGGLLTVAEIERQIDFLASWKANQYYFYNEVSIALDGYASVNFRQSYSKDDIRRIIAYGSRRHVDVVPFIAFYGHMHDFLKNEEYAPLGIGRYGHEFDPRKKEVRAVLADWIGQYARLFPSRFFHVGFDETWETNRIAREQDSSVRAEDLWLSHLAFVTGELKKYNKSVLAWTDMTNYYPDIMQRMPPDVTPVIWEYSPDTAALRHFMDPVLQAGKPFFIQPGVSGWGHIYPAADYTYDNIDLCLEAGLKNRTMGFITSVWTDAVEPLTRPSWSFMAYGCAEAWQGAVVDRKAFGSAWPQAVAPRASADVTAACADLAEATRLLQQCLGRNTSNMPGGTIIESWSNPFDPYYLDIARKNTDTLKLVRICCERAQGACLRAFAQASPADSGFVESLRVSARLIHYEATRFLWASVICRRWDEAMLQAKQNHFVFYDISYICHGLIQDAMDELGTLKDDYRAAWLSESMPYRLNTMLGRFDVEYGLWEKLLLKIIDYRIKHSSDVVAPGSFTETFAPAF